MRAIFLFGFTPVPVQVATLGADVTEVNPGVFTTAMLLSRALRYGGLRLLVFWFSEEVHQLLRRHRRSALILGLLITAVLAFLLFGPEGK